MYRTCTGQTPQTCSESLGNVSLRAARQMHDTFTSGQDRVLSKGDSRPSNFDALYSPRTLEESRKSRAKLAHLEFRLGACKAALSQRSLSWTAGSGEAESEAMQSERTPCSCSSMLMHSGTRRSL